MFAVVANGIQTICRTQRQLDRIISIYPYPKFSKVNTEAEAREWIARNSRGISSLQHEKYGSTARWGYARVRYFIADDNIYYNIDTSKLGFIRPIVDEDDVKIDARQSMLKIKICGVKLNDILIPHHIIAIRRVLKILGDYVDVDVTVPDISVFLAVTKYSGSNYLIRGLQKDISMRLGAVSLTVEE